MVKCMMGVAYFARGSTLEQISGKTLGVEIHVRTVNNHFKHVHIAKKLLYNI